MGGCDSSRRTADRPIRRIPTRAGTCCASVRAAPELVAAGLAIGYAQGIAEDLLRQAGVASVLFDPAAPWRARPVTDKQRAVLERMRVEIPDGLTAGEASDLISAAFARRTRPVGG